MISSLFIIECNLSTVYDVFVYLLDSVVKLHIVWKKKIIKLAIKVFDFGYLYYKTNFTVTPLVQTKILLCVCINTIPDIEMVLTALSP